MATFSHGLPTRSANMTSAAAEEHELHHALPVAQHPAMNPVSELRPRAESTGPLRMLLQRLSSPFQVPLRNAAQRRAARRARRAAEALAPVSPPECTPECHSSLELLAQEQCVHDTPFPLLPASSQTLHASCTAGLDGVLQQRSNHSSSVSASDVSAGAAAAPSATTLQQHGSCLELLSGSSDSGYDTSISADAVPLSSRQSEREVLVVPAPQTPEALPCSMAKRPWHARVRAALGRLGSWVRQGSMFVASHIRPQGAGGNDNTWSERVINVATCWPFVMVGCTVLRECPGAAARQFGRMFLAVGGVAAMYHAAWGPVKHVMRVADYWSIAVATGMLRNVVYTRRRAAPHPVPAVLTTGPTGQGSGAVAQTLGRAGQACLTVGQYCVIPFFPSLVSTLNLVLVEVRCLTLAVCMPDALLRKWAQHALLAVCAASMFGIDHVRECAGKSVVPGMHAAWHVLSAAGILTTTPFLLHVEAGTAPAALLTA